GRSQTWAGEQPAIDSGGFLHVVRGELSTSHRVKPRVDELASRDAREVPSAFAYEDAGVMLLDECDSYVAATVDSQQSSVETEIRAARVAARQQAIGSKAFLRPADYTAEPHGSRSARAKSKRVADFEDPIAHFDRSRGAHWHMRIRTRLEQP